MAWVRTEFLKNGCVTADKIASGALSGSLIADGGVGTSQIAADAVDSEHIAAGAVDEEHLASGVVSMSKLDSGVLASTSGTILSASVIAMNTTPVTIIPAPGTGSFNELVRVHWFLDFESAAYDGATEAAYLQLRYTDKNGELASESVPGDQIGGATEDFHFLAQPVTGTMPVDNAPVVAMIASGSWFAAAGDSPLKYEAIYRVASTDPTA